MGTISVTRPSEGELKRLGVEAWSPWQCAPSDFDWQYADTETAYVLKGKAIVTGPDGETVELGPGDLAVFPKGLRCRWRVMETVEKVYKYG